jgi:hypothetical protein
MDSSLIVELDHSVHSVLRELIIEHQFIAEVLRECWVRGIADVEVLRSEADSFGYDLVMSRGDVVRHIQLKCLKAGGKADHVKVGLKLAEKPSGCVIWIVLTDELRFHHFLWFGNAPGEGLPSLLGYKTATHTKGDSSGLKSERPAHREVPRKHFLEVPTLDALLTRLLGINTPTT